MTRLRDSIASLQAKMAEVASAVFGRKDTLSEQSPAAEPVGSAIHSATLTNDETQRATANARALMRQFSKMEEPQAPAIETEEESKHPVTGGTNPAWDVLRPEVREILSYINNADRHTFELDMANKNINATEMQCIAAAIKETGSAITCLVADHNKIGDEGAQAIAQLIQAPDCGLIRVGLDANGIGDAGAQAIALAMQDQHAKLSVLNLAHNAITSVGARHIAAAIESPHYKGTLINLLENPIDDAGKAALDAAVVAVDLGGRVSF